MADFEERLTALINTFSLENNSNTPDFILASYLNDCLKAFNLATRSRGEYYGDKSSYNTLDKYKLNPIPYPFEVDDNVGLNLNDNKSGLGANKAEGIKNSGGLASSTILTSGKPVPDDYSHTAIDPKTGLQQDYVVMSKDELAKGFVRLFRDKYTHLTCGTDTTISHSIAATYAADPSFYTETFCVECKKHFPLYEFVWAGTNIKVGT